MDAWLYIRLIAKTSFRCWLFHSQQHSTYCFPYATASYTLFSLAGFFRRNLHLMLPIPCQLERQPST